MVKRIYDGTTQLNAALQPLMQAAQQALVWTAEQRARIILRVDLEAAASKMSIGSSSRVTSFTEKITPVLALSIWQKV